MGARISEQTQDLQGDVPTLTQAVNDKLSTHPAGRWLVEQ